MSLWAFFFAHFEHVELRCENSKNLSYLALNNRMQFDKSKFWQFPIFNFDFKYTDVVKGGVFALFPRVEDFSLEEISVEQDYFDILYSNSRVTLNKNIEENIIVHDTNRLHLCL